MFIVAANVGLGVLAWMGGSRLWRRLHYWDRMVWLNHTEPLLAVSRDHLFEMLYINHCSVLPGFRLLCNKVVLVSRL